MKSSEKMIKEILEYLENKKVYGKSINFSERDITINEIVEEIEEIIYQEEE